MLKKLILTASCCALTLAAPALSAKAASNSIWSGIDRTDDSLYGYAGIVHAWNKDMLANGILMRGSVGVGSYEYNTVGVTGLEVDGDSISADLMVGYQYFYGESTRLTGYLGIHHEDHDLSPTDVENSVQGDETGAKAILEFSTSLADKVSLSGAGSYSTAFDSYWSRMQVGYDFGMFTVGPEVSVLGNEGFDQQRYGLAVSNIDLGGFAKLGFNGGHAAGSRTGDDSMYLGVNFSKSW
jgi:hypothetical protein